MASFASLPSDPSSGLSDLDSLLLRETYLQNLHAAQAVQLSQLDEQGLQIQEFVDDLTSKRPGDAEVAEVEQQEQHLGDIERQIVLLAGVAGEFREAVSAHQAVYLKRRTLLNLLHTVRGNVRVFCRCRPVLPREKGKTGVLFPDPGRILVDMERHDARQQFTFDEAYGPESKTSEIWASVEPLCTSVMDGYNVCIFAYGQTGSGKTYTMEGTKDDRGINYLALQKLFAMMEQRGGESALSISLTEIYNESNRDLLASGSKGGAGGGAGGGPGSRGGGGATDGAFASAAARRAGKLRGAAGGSGSGSGEPTKVACADTAAVMRAMRKGYQNRTTASTKSNDTSSRSHCVLTVWVQTSDAMTNTQTFGKLQLVDLAGSERLKKSEATGQQLTEAKYINKSLSALGNVIAARVTKNKHVPYRDSKLTLMLQDSLVGDSKVLMFVNINPLSSHCGETSCSLRFAERANKVSLGMAKVNTSSGGGSEQKGESERSNKGLKRGQQRAVSALDLIRDEMEEGGSSGGGEIKVRRDSALWGLCSRGDWLEAGGRRVFDGIECPHVFDAKWWARKNIIWHRMSNDAHSSV